MLTGKQIRDARNRAGWSQERLAEMLGVTFRTVGNWERGQTAPQSREPELLEILQPYLREESSSSDALKGASDMDLISELARRLARADKSGEKVGNDEDSSSNTQAAGSAAQDRKVVPIRTDWRGVAPEDVPADVAALKDGKGMPPNTGRGAGEESQVDPRGED